VALKYDAVKGAPEGWPKGPDDRGRDPGQASGTGSDRPRAGAHRTLYKAWRSASYPGDLYEAVAHLLAFVFSLRAKGRPTATTSSRPVLL